MNKLKIVARVLLLLAAVLMIGDVILALLSWSILAGYLMLVAAVLYLVSGILYLFTDDPGTGAIPIATSVMILIVSYLMW